MAFPVKVFVLSVYNSKHRLYMHAWTRHKCLVSFRGTEQREKWLSGLDAGTSKQKEPLGQWSRRKKEAAMPITDEGRHSDEHADVV